MRTPSHGGYFVPPHHNRLIPAAFPAEAVKAAQATFDGWIAPKLAGAAIAKAEG